MKIACPNTIYFIGLDGGGTKTKAVLIDGRAHERARAAM